MMILSTLLNSTRLNSTLLDSSHLNSTQRLCSHVIRSVVVWVMMILSSHLISSLLASPQLNSTHRLCNHVIRSVVVWVKIIPTTKPRANMTFTIDKKFGIKLVIIVMYRVNYLPESDQIKSIDLMLTNNEILEVYNFKQQEYHDFIDAIAEYFKKEK